MHPLLTLIAPLCLPDPQEMFSPEWGQRRAKEGRRLRHYPGSLAALALCSAAHFSRDVSRAAWKSISMQGSRSIYISQFIYTHYRAKPWQQANLRSLPAPIWLHTHPCWHVCYLSLWLLRRRSLLCWFVMNIACWNVKPWHVVTILYKKGFLVWLCVFMLLPDIGGSHFKF